MPLIIDDRDPFVYVLADLFLQRGCNDIRLLCFDDISMEEIAGLAPRAMVISSDRGCPGEDRNVVALAGGVAGSIPLLGIGSGYLALVESFGGKVRQADVPRHGKTAEVYHHGEGLFAGVPLPFEAACYHSLVADSRTMPSDLEVTAFSGEGEMMALKYRHGPVYGVQFHPASILTEYGQRILDNFISLAGECKCSGREGGMDDGTHR
ncbi:MAG: C26 family cysteine hydrolase domain-containing family [Firmicutes bacterium]|jgi:anthranilate synthase/aminodeoxychorismate synthase-like glutamine amidotransferase|nr:C26 family cysteine hydrolase domain-containing family [Bacillota bacterium]